MIHKPFLKFFSAYLLKIKVIMVFLLVSLSILVKAQEAFFIPLQSDIRTSDSLLDSLVNKSLFTTSKNSIRKILTNEPDSWNLIIPLQNESNWVLALEKVKIWDNLASIETASGKKVSLPSEGVHYRGTVKGHKGSLVSMSIFENGMTGFVSFPDLGNFQMNPNTYFSTGSFINHVLYPVSSLPIRKTYECAAAEGEPYRAEELKSFGTLRAEPKCIKVYYELDYDIFQDKGGVAPSLQFLTSLFNQVGTLFSNDGVQIRLSGVKIWDIRM